MKILTVTYDVTELSPVEIDILIGEATVQAERTDGDSFSPPKRECRCLGAEVSEVVQLVEIEVDLYMEDEDGEELAGDDPKALAQLREQFPYVDFEYAGTNEHWNGFPIYKVRSTRTLVEKFLNTDEMGSGDLIECVEFVEVVVM